MIIEKKICLFFMFGTLYVFTTSCSVENAHDESSPIPIVKEFFLRNTREYTKGNVMFEARPIKRGNNYKYLLVGSPRMPYAGTPPVLIRLPDGTVLNLNDASAIKTLKQKSSSISDVSLKYCHEFAPINEIDEFRRWPANTIHIQMEYWLFFIQENAILAFSATTYGWDEGGLIPAIGNPDDGKMFTFPLTQNQVIKVFGYPDRIREYLAE